MSGWRRRSRRLTLAALLAATLVPSSGGASAELQWFPQGGAYFGAGVGKQTDSTLPACRDLAPQKARTLFEGTSCVGRFLYIDRVYHMWDGSYSRVAWPTPDDKWSRDQGRRLFISWHPKRTNGTYVKWKDISKGYEDAQIDATADRVKAFGANMYLAFHAEPEITGTSGFWGTHEEFRAAWQRIVDRFRARGVTNVRWVLTLMGWTFNPASGQNPMNYYPGSTYVDAIGADSFNWFGCKGGDKWWLTFDDLFKHAYNFTVARGKPFAIAEWGSVEDPNDPLRKALWYRNAAEWIKSHPNTKVVSYFQYHDVSQSSGRNCDWSIDTSPASLVAFRELAADAHFAP